MWVFFRDGFVSVVQQHGVGDRMVVRARFPGHAALFLGVDASVEEETPDSDYRYRVVVPREDVEAAMGRVAREVNYGNFKQALRAEHMHVPAMETWEVWFRAQHRFHMRRG